MNQPSSGYLAFAARGPRRFRPQSVFQLAATKRDAELPAHFQPPAASAEATCWLLFSSLLFSSLLPIPPKPPCRVVAIFSRLMTRGKSVEIDYLAAPKEDESVCDYQQHERRTAPEGHPPLGEQTLIYRT